MKIRFIALAMVLLSWLCTVAQTMPQFSDENNEHWYYIVFTSGDAVIQDNGAGNKAKTAIMTPGTTSQQWKLTGTADEFTLVSHTGNAVCFDGFFKTTDNLSSAAKLSLTKSGLADFADSWELVINDKTDQWSHMNQYGGNGAGHELGAYTADDSGNALTFLSISDAPDDIPVLEPIKEFAVKEIASYTPSHRHTLWYTKPATSMTGADQWMEYALPIGNGEFGAMIFGGVNREEIQFNDKSVWTGTSTIRGSYQNFGNLYIEDISGIFGADQDKAITDYVRYLDLTTATAGVEYKSPDGSVTFTREYISSFPDKVVAIRLKASKPQSISVRLKLFNGIKKGFIRPTYDNNGCGSFDGKLNLIDFKAKFKVVPTGGTMIAGNNGIEVINADELLVILGGATNFDQHAATYISDPQAMRDMVDNRVDAASAKGWESLLNAHVADYKTYFDRMELSLEGAQNTMSPTSLIYNYNDKRKYKPTSPASLMLEELYFTYGRYLLISCSRGMDSPANLQGIWNNSATPAWQCDIHSNINVQMNYWPAEVTNLSEMHAPYLNYIHSMALEHNEWQEYARRSGQTVGWTCFTQNNIFGHSDYAENYVIANAWYTYHLWQHYIYTLDRDFLRTRALPVMVSCTRFWLERLVKDEDGTWVAPAEWSPEHGPSAEDGTAHAQQIIAELFKSTLEAISILGDDADGVDDAFISELNEKYENLDRGLAIETYTGKWGDNLNGIATGSELLREWKTSTYDAGENGHRHQSHLMALYPFDQITPESDCFNAAVNSLTLRGDESTGWSLGWRICLWARSLDATHAHKIVKRALRHATSYSQTSGGGGVYYNLFDSHAPFQIDGNFGYTAGVTEMLLQSHGGWIRLLPALPADIWKSGYLRGARAVGNFEIDQEWKDGTLSVATITSGSGRDCNILYRGIAKATVTDLNGEKIDVTASDDDHISFPTVAGGCYTVTMPGQSGVTDIVAPGMDMTIAGGIVTVKATGMVTITAYDLQGRTIASTPTGNLDLNAFNGTPLIVKAVTEDAVKVMKVIIR